MTFGTALAARSSRCNGQQWRSPPLLSFVFNEFGDLERCAADKSSREADQNRCQGRQSRSLRNVPDGGGRNPTGVVRCDNAEDCCTTIAPDGNVHMSNPVAIHVGQTSGEARPYEYAVGFWDGQRPKSWSVSCRSNRAGRRDARKPPESSGGDSNRRVIWGIPA